MDNRAKIMKDNQEMANEWLAEHGLEEGYRNYRGLHHFNAMEEKYYGA